MSKLGTLFIIAAPSGAGKTSLVKALRARMPELLVSVSYTTRARRLHEVDGKDYHFVGEAEFNEMVAQQDFLEHAKVYGFYYGTSKAWVTQQCEQGNDVILEIDWQGARQIKALMKDAVSVFILPPSQKELLHRLQQRQQDATQVITARMAQMEAEISHYAEFDYLIINDDFEAATLNLMHIVFAQRLKTTIQQQKLTMLLAELLEKQ